MSNQALERIASALERIAKALEAAPDDRYEVKGAAEPMTITVETPEGPVEVRHASFR